MRSVAHLIDGVGLQHVDTTHVIGPDAAADLDDDRVLLTVDDLELRAGRPLIHGLPLPACRWVRMGCYARR